MNLHKNIKRKLSEYRYSSIYSVLTFLFFSFSSLSLYLSIYIHMIICYLIQLVTLKLSTAYQTIQYLQANNRRSSSKSNISPGQENSTSVNAIDQRSSKVNALRNMSLYCVFVLLIT